VVIGTDYIQLPLRARPQRPPFFYILIYKKHSMWMWKGYHDVMWRI